MTTDTKEVVAVIKISHSIVGYTWNLEHQPPGLCQGEYFDAPYCSYSAHADLKSAIRDAAYHLTRDS